jgi:hypothetical protein
VEHFSIVFITDSSLLRSDALEREALERLLIEPLIAK